jgi:predicted nucleic-acid-binding Zn-ribbon protein
MSKFENQEPQSFVVKGYELKCPICNNRQFRTKQVLLNTTAMTFFNLDWANRNAKSYVCSNCTHIMWFME